MSKGMLSPTRARDAVSLIMLTAALLLNGCGDPSKRDRANPVAARVNGEAITVQQLNFALQQGRGVPAEHAEAAGRQILERIIDQELAVQRARELKIDRDPRVVMQIEAARREVLARAYLDSVGEAAARPTADDVRKYYDDHPALFEQRRLYNLQELAIEARPEQVDELRASLVAAKNVNEFVDWLRAHGYRFAGNQAVRAAEQLPLASLKSLAAMQDGQAVLSATPTGVSVTVLAGSRPQPIDRQQAMPHIEQHLLNERKRELMRQDLASLRQAAAIEYRGRFAVLPPPAAADEPASSIPADGSGPGN